MDKLAQYLKDFSEDYITIEQETINGMTYYRPVINVEELKKALEEFPNV